MSPEVLPEENSFFTVSTAKAGAKFNFAPAFALGKGRK